MEEYEGDDVLAELARLCDELGLDHMDSEAMACETHIFVDTNGNPHECWEAGSGLVNVTVAMTPGQAVRITDVMAENARLREERDTYRDLVGLMDHPDLNAKLQAENDKLRELVRDYDRCTMHADCSRCEYDGKISTHCPLSPCFPDDDELRELGIEVEP